MRVLTVVFLVAPLVCATVRSQPQREGPQTQAGAAARDNPLFLHLLSPRAYTDPPVEAHRIVTARVYPSEDFSVSVGADENPFTRPWDGACTSPLWSTNGTPKVRSLDPLWNSGDATLAGRIEQVNGSFLARLQGRERTTVNYFNGKIELEKPFYEQGSYFHDGRVWQVWFVLSTNSDCGGFVKALENGTLSRPDVVDRNSPLVERWVHDKPDAEPGAGPSSVPSKSLDNSKAPEDRDR